MGWDSNWDSTEAVGKLPLNCLVQLRAALAERASVVASPPTLPGVPASGPLPGAAWFSAFQSAVTALFAKYADHTQYSGDYSGQATIPVWSEANMLSAISAGSRIAAPTSGKLRAAWAYQQYLMLNKLRWAYATQGAMYYKTKSASATTTFADAVTNFNAASWSSWGSTSGASARHVAYVGGVRTYVARGAVKFDISLSGFDYRSNIYAYFFSSPAGYTHEDNDYGSSDGQYLKMYDADGTDGTAYTIEIGSIDTASVTGTGKGWYTSYGSGDGVNKPIHNIYKLDVSGGFDYID